MRGSKESKKHGTKWSGALWFLLPLTLVIVLKTDFLPQVARFRETGFSGVADEVAHKVSSLGLKSARWEHQAPDAERIEAAREDSIAVSPTSAAPSSGANVDATREYKQPNQTILATKGPKDSSLIKSDVGEPAVSSKLTCNFSSYHSSTCRMEGDVRIDGKSATVYVVASSTYRAENSTIRIRPYARKWEEGTMSKIREISIRSSPSSEADDVVLPPRCTVRHDVPAVIFSTDAYKTNYFHAMSDVIVPLYTTTREFSGNVQLLVTGYDYEWLAKYRRILAALSLYPVIDLDADTAVRCFPAAIVGLEGHRILGVDPDRSRNGYTMMSFRDFLRSTFSLHRSWATPASRGRSSGKKKPRLVMVLRRHSRALTNEDDAVSAMTELGFEVVAATPELVRDMDRFASVVNSCDVMVGVHGAGLTNMVFLPHNATVVQIIPWGAMKWACWYDFGEPVPGMGLRYVEYEVSAQETTLKDKYPMDHPVFTDPLSVHRKGFNDVWATFLDGQNVTLDIPRFRGTMQQVYQSITTD